MASSAFDDAGGASNSPSLAVRLMQVAGEYELERKRERSKLESRISTLTHTNTTLEERQRAQRTEMEALTRQVATLSSSLDTLRREQVDSMGDIEAALVEARVCLYERGVQLLQILRYHAKAASGGSAGPGFASNRVAMAADENVNPLENGAGALGAMLKTIAVASSEPLMAQLEAETEGLKEYATSSILRAAELGREEDLTRVLAPITNRLAKPGKEDGDGQAMVRALPKRLEPILEGAMRKAVAGGHISIVKRLMRYGVSLAGRSADDGFHSSLLHTAAEHGHEVVVKMLLSAAKDSIHVDDRDAYDRTPLHYAAANDHAAVAKTLLLNGADPTMRDLSGCSVLDILAGTDKLVTDGAADSPQARLYRSGELRTNPPAVAVARVFDAGDVMFWNASVRANKYYSERKFDRAIQAYETAIELAAAARVTVAPRDLATLHYNRARALYRLGRHVAAVQDCDAALKHDSTYRNALAQRAECHMSLFDFERAVRDFQSLLESDPVDRQWARRLVDARSMRDMGHYGILGVRKDADSAALKRAYRSLCLRWHPDKHGTSPEDITRANLAFRRISDAYETLSDSYKRMVYDMDPKSNLGIPDSASAGRPGRSGSNGSGAATPNLEIEGLDKWYARELEKEAERDREQRALDARLSAEDSTGVEARKAARELRRKILSVSHRSQAAPQSDAIPQGTVATTVSSARVTVASGGIASAAGLRRSVSSGAVATEVPRTKHVSNAEASTTSEGTTARPATEAALPPLRSVSSATWATHTNLHRGAAEHASASVGPTPVSSAAPTPDELEADSTKETGSRDESASPPPPPPVPQASVPPAAAPQPTAQRVGANVESSGQRSPARTSATHSARDSAASSPSRASGVDAAIAATAARARAAVAQAEAFVKLVNEHAHAVDQAERSTSYRAPSDSPTGSPTRVPERFRFSGDDADASELRARFEARLRAQADARGMGTQAEPERTASHHADWRRSGTTGEFAHGVPADDNIDISHDMTEQEFEMPGDDSIDVSDDEDASHGPHAYVPREHPTTDDDDDEAHEDAAHDSDKFDPVRYAAYLRELGSLAADLEGDDDEELMAAIRRAASEQSLRGAAADAGDATATGTSRTGGAIGRRKPIPSLDELEAELAGLAAEAMSAAAAARTRHAL